MVLEPVILKDASKHLTPPLTCTKLTEVDLLGLGVRVSASFRKKILCLVFCVFLMQFGFRRPAPFVSSPIHLLCLCSRSCAWKWQNQLVNVKQKYVQLITHETLRMDERQMETSELTLALISFSDRSLSLSLSFGVAHAPFACQRWGLPHRLAQCVTPGKGLV